MVINARRSGTWVSKRRALHPHMNEATGAFYSFNDMDLNKIDKNLEIST